MDKKNNRQILAIMFIDIVGYSQKMSEDESETLKLLENYKHLVVPIIETHDGLIIKWLGDGLFCQFTSVLKAVNCALLVHNKLNEYNQNPKGKFQINVRIGIHLGDVVQQDDDLFGDGVNVAARIEPKAPTNGICITGTVYSAISSHPQFDIIPLGKIELKNIRFTHDLYLVKTGYEEKNFRFPTQKKIKKNSSTRTVKFRLILTLIILMIISYIFIEFPFQYENHSATADSSKIKKEEALSQQYILDLIGSEGNQFYQDVELAVSFDKIIKHLEKQKQAMKLVYGKKDDFFEQEGKYIILLKDRTFTKMLYNNNKRFIDIKSGERYNRLKEAFKGHTTIWVEILE